MQFGGRDRDYSTFPRACDAVGRGKRRLCNVKTTPGCCGTEKRSTGGAPHFAYPETMRMADAASVTGTMYDVLDDSSGCNGSQLNEKGRENCDTYGRRTTTYLFFGDDRTGKPFALLTRVHLRRARARKRRSTSRRGSQRKQERGQRIDSGRPSRIQYCYWGKHLRLRPHSPTVKTTFENSIH